jgi:hypothetical protein
MSLKRRPLLQVIVPFVRLRSKIGAARRRPLNGDGALATDELFQGGVGRGCARSSEPEIISKGKYR